MGYWPSYCDIDPEHRAGTAFSTGWKIESIQPTRFEINPQAADLGFSPGGPKAWFSIIRRTG